MSALNSALAMIGQRPVTSADAKASGRLQRAGSLPARSRTRRPAGVSWVCIVLILAVLLTAVGATQAQTSESEPDATGAPAVSGVPQAGRTLTAELGTIADPDGLPATFPDDYTFQWVRVDADGVSNPVNVGANSATYTLVAADVGNKLKVNVSFTDDSGVAEGPLESAATADAAVAAQGACPAHNDWCATLTVGLLQVDTVAHFGFLDGPLDNIGDLSHISIESAGTTNQVRDLYWAFDSATSSGEYVFYLHRFLPRGTELDLEGTKLIADASSEDSGISGFIGKYVWTGQDGLDWIEGQQATVSVRLPNNAATGAPAISGAPQAGRTLTAELGTIADADGLPATFPGDYTFQWVRVDADGSSNPVDVGTNAATYTPVAADVGNKLKVRVSFTDGDGDAEGPIESDATAHAVIAAAGACPADNDWCATLTVEAWDRPTGTLYGYRYLTGYGALTDRTIEYGGKRFDFTQMSFADQSPDRVIVYVSEFLTDGAVFNLGGTEFTADAASRHTLLEKAHIWTAPAGFAWIAGQEVTVSVEIPAAADDRLSELALTGSDGNSVALNVAFDRETADYTAPLAKPVDEVTFLPTTSVDGATVELLDGDDHSIADSDLNAEGHQVALEVGLNTIRIKVTAQDGVSTQTYTFDLTRAATAPATGAPTIAGVPQVPRTLTAGIGTIGDHDGLPSAFPGDYTFQWVRVDSLGNETNVGTDSAYTAVAADVGHTIKVKVSFTDDGGMAEGPLESAETAPVAAEPGACPADNDWCATLTVGVWSSGADAYHGFRHSPAAGALDDRTIEFAGKSIDIAGIAIADRSTDSMLVHVSEYLPRGSVFNLGGTEFTTDASTELGSADDKLHSWSLPSGFAWIDGQNVTVSVQLGNLVAEGAPAIAGTPQVGRILTATKGTIDDADGTTGADNGDAGHAFTYQWVRTEADGTNREDIAGATGRTYTPVAADEGKKLKVAVSFNDDAGNAEGPLESDATAAVAPPSADPTLSALALTDGDGNAVALNETFASTTLTYTASVAHAVSEVEVAPTTNDGGATVEYLDGSDNALADADGIAEGHQVSLVPGPNTVKVKVTAANGTATRTYTVTVIRAEFSNRNVWLTGAELGSLEAYRRDASVDICWDLESTVPTGGDVIIEMRMRSFWHGPEPFGPWKEVARGDTVTLCGDSNTGVQLTHDGLWRGQAFSMELRLRRGADVLDASGLFMAQAPNRDDAVLNAELSEPTDEDGQTVDRPAGPFMMELALVDPDLRALTTETATGLAATDFEVTNATVAIEPWYGQTYKVTVTPAVLGNPVSVRLPASTVLGVGESLTADGANAYTRPNTASNLVTTDTAASGNPGLRSPHAPLTASFGEVPAEHDGSTPFQVRLSFNAPIGISYVTLRDEAVRAKGGTVTGARRVDGSSALWELTVAPSGTGTVTVALAATAACDEPGAVCTSDGRALANAASATVPGPSARPPLTASFGDVPAEHDGSTPFQVRLSFSAPIPTRSADRVVR